MTPAEQIALWSDRLRDISAMGLRFSKNIHDEGAFRAVQTIAMEMLALATGESLFTTLEPCLMCAGAILLHHVGRLVFGSSDPNGGVASCLDSLPPYFRHEFSLIQWTGPALPAECDPLYFRIQELERQGLWYSGVGGH